MGVATPEAAQEVETGKLIVSVAKRFKAYSAADRAIAQFFTATSVSGRAGLVASAIRYHHKLTPERFGVFCSEEGFNRNDIRTTIVPWLTQEGLADIKVADGKVSSVTSLVLVYESILRAVTHLFEELEPTAEERGCLVALTVASDLPTPKSMVLHRVSTAVGEESATKALGLAKAYRIVEERSGKGLREPILFSPAVWHRAIGRASIALSALKPDQRAVVEDLVRRVREYQGYPEEELRRVARRHNAEPMLELAIAVGLISQTWILTGDGTRRSFLTTPHFHADMAAEHGEDAFDRVKIFLDSIRNGQHFGLLATGRIWSNPDKLLRKLINVGEIGPCTAIGRDYTMAEKAGIVSVKRSTLKPGQYVMRLVQEDTVRQVHDVVTRGHIENAVPMTARLLGPDGKFISSEEGRIAEVPDAVAEAERAVILALREG